MKKNLAVRKVFCYHKSMDINKEIRANLKNLAEQDLKKFNSKLIPTINPKSVLGVRTPLLKQYAKTLYKQGDCASFLADLPHEYLEENLLHAFIVAQNKDYQTCLKETQEFLPYIDNWAVCDCFKPFAFKKNKEKLLMEIKKWLTSERTYTIRFAVNMLMTHFLDKSFSYEYARLVASLKKDDYYVKMVVAWYFATALAKQWDSVVSIIEQRILPTWIHNKTIQKAIESFRISKEQKEYLKTLKIKEKK